MKTGALVYTNNMAISFLGGLTFILALAAGVVRPWRGLFLLWGLGVFYGSTGLVPGLTPLYVAIITVAGALLIAAGERLAGWWPESSRQALTTGGQLLLASSATLLLAGVFLGPLWGLATGGALGALGAAYLHRRYPLAATVIGLFPLILRGIALLLVGILFNGRLLGLF
ncbi:hypothetical protein [Moorella sp. Hama-1]|uniref:hypothetical protein n=1 Tax=Moorella sp. Hama-1 TaxID=2138101 RepID=UPI001379E25A|nr:hypothetical protein [Moorella sp. Hama-1]MDN5361228.1 hypothetical protein [Moorella sp. (in: firmicutes)]BCV21913.1 hypothetical protein hamaS1_19820 [Moorella sp. Hama-1]